MRSSLAMTRCGAEEPTVTGFRDIPYPFEENWISVGGVRTCWVEEGDGVPVLLLCPAGRGLLHYRELFGLRSRRRFIAVDLPGWGKADKPDVSYNQDYYVDWLRQFVDALGVDRPHLVGNSMGGQLAARLLAADPSCARSLSLIAIPGNIAWWRRFLMPLFLSQRTIRNMRPWQFRRAMRQNFYRWPARAEEIVAKGVELSRGPDWPDYARCLARCLRTALAQDIAPVLARLGGPVLFIWGKQDRVCPVAALPALAARVADARSCVLEECGHFPPVERPRPTLDALEHFWGKQESRAAARD